MADTTILPGNASIVVTGIEMQVSPIMAGAIEVKVKPSAGAYAPGYGPDASRNLTWFASVNNLRGIVQVQVGVSGQSASPVVLDSDINVVVGMSGTPIKGTLVDLDVAGQVNVVVEPRAEVYVISGRENWVGWSKIGEASFVHDRSNEAGYRPMDWNGWALQVLPLEEMCVVYGDNGICMMYPVDSPAASFGFKNISKVGIKSIYSVGGTEQVHYFITQNGDLWKLTKQGPERLGFREFLSPLVDPILTYDEVEQRLFISDNASGYIFKDGLGGGCECVTGLSRNFFVGPSDFRDHLLEVMTDTIDLGHRGIKNITFVEVGIDTVEDLFVAVDFRYVKSEEWRTSSWVATNPEGVARIQVAGVEFRIRVKQNTYDEIRLDYINVRHQRPDKRFIRGTIQQSEG